MPNKHDVTKNFVSFSIPRELLHKLSQVAEERGITRTAYCIHILAEATKGVVLTEERKQRVNAEIILKKEERKGGKKLHCRTAGDRPDQKKWKAKHAKEK